MESVTEKHRRIWKEKRILRVIYEEWYEKIVGDLSKVEGPSVELGAGSGNFKTYKPDVISADVEKFDWLDLCFDAHVMPFENESVSNLILVDVLHHLSNPVKFLHEAKRVLKNKGRIVLLEPFPSPYSLWIYKRFHPEPFVFDVDYYSKPDVGQKDPWESNQAIPYLIFFKEKNKFEEIFGNVFNMLKKKKLSFILYPASGGFENKAMIPDSMIPAFQLIEKILAPAASLLAFRCYVVIEKRNA